MTKDRAAGHAGALGVRGARRQECVGSRARGAGGRWGAQAAGVASGRQALGAGRRAGAGRHAGARGARGREAQERGARQAAAGHAGRARLGLWARGLGTRAGYGPCTRCTRPVFGLVRLGIFPESIFGRCS